MFEVVHNSFWVRLVVGTFIIVAGIALVPTVLPSRWTDEVAIVDAHQATKASDPNRVASGLDAMTSQAEQTLHSLSEKPAQVIRATSQAVATTASTAARTISNFGKAAGTKIYRDLSFAGSGLRWGLSYIAQLPNRTYLTTSQLPRHINSLIRPSAQNDIPVIDEQLAALYSTYASLPPETEATPEPATDDRVIWPIHGRITTRFGVPHRPFQVTHTGLDISSGNRSGVIAVKPFRAGIVLDAIRSNYGLGNHVIVDHGNGLTSVYAHLSSITVQKGQEVSTETTLGLEGSTGLSTGPHLHFEIRINGQPVNPLDYIDDQP